ncbi:MAG: CoA transferase [Chloroflexi bacterium]|nr:CoA transferase [Chloroflexota bacterium]
MENATGPLSGIRVIDFSWIVAGPQATRILADFGAEVLRIEYEGRLDSIRINGQAPGAAPESLNASGFFNNLNRNKLSMTLNVRHPMGMDLLKQLIAKADVVLENFSAGTLDTWGLSYEAMQEINPAIIYISMSGFGQTGRNRLYTTWGPTAQALSGLTFLSGLPGEPPAGWGYSYMDHTAGYYGAMAVLMALHHRNRTGEGQRIDLSQVEAGMVLTGPTILDYAVNGRPARRPGFPPGNRSPHPATAPHNTYRCAGTDSAGQTRWIAIAVSTEEQWQALVRAMGNPAWASGPQFATGLDRVDHQDDLDRHIEAWTMTRDAHETMYLLQGMGVPAAAVQSSEDRIEHDPQLRARGFYPVADHPELGPHRFEGMPAHLSRTPWTLRSGAPLLGEHNEFVCKELLGMTDEQFIGYFENGVF